MTGELLLTLVAVLLATLVGGLIRVARGPTPADAMLAAQLFGTTGVGILLLLAEALALPALRDVALVFAVLAVLAVVAFVRRGWPPPSTRAEETGDAPEGRG